MNQNGQIREFRWPTTIRAENLEKFYIHILKGVSVYKGRLLYPGIGACAYKRGTFKFLILQIVKISFIGGGTYMRGNRVR